MARKKAKAKKSATKGKAKGSTFERDMCKRLSLWWSAGTSSQIFWRNSGLLARVSGCIAHQYGDMHAIDERGQPFVDRISTEFKFYKDLRVLDIIDKPGKMHVTLLDHWAQCKRDAEASEREPMLVAKRNFAEPFVMCYHDLAHCLVEDGDVLEFYDGNNYVCVFALAKLEEFAVPGEFISELVALADRRNVGDCAPSVQP